MNSADIFEFLRSCKHVGLVGSIRLFNPMALGSDSAVRLRGHGHPIQLRRDGIDRQVFLSVFAARLYNKHYIDSDAKLIIDAGAHAGFSACYFAEHFPGARIVALEPDPENYARLVANTRTHANVTAMHAALWPTDGTAYVQESDSSWNIQVSDKKQGRAVRAVSIPALLRETGSQTVDVLKMNVEGAEREIFSGPVEWLSQVRLLMIALHDQFWPGCAEPVYAAVSRLGFQKLQSGPIDIIRLRS